MNVNHTAGGYDEKGIDVADTCYWSFLLFQESGLEEVEQTASSFQGNIAFELACAVACVGFS